MAVNTPHGLWRPPQANRFIMGGCNATNSGGGGGGGDTLMTQRVIVNDGASTWNKESVWLLYEQFADGSVSSSEDLVVKLDSDGTEFVTQVWPNNYSSGCINTCTLFVRIPANKMVSGNNAVSVYKRTQARSTTSTIADNTISGLNLSVTWTGVTDYAGNTDGSGSFRSVVNDYTSSVYKTELCKGPVCRVFRYFTPAVDQTGGAAHAGGLYSVVWLIALEASGGGMDTYYIAPFVHQGDLNNSDPDVRRWATLNVLVNGSVLVGSLNGDHQFDAGYLPYFAKPGLLNARALGWMGDETKRPPFRNVLPYDRWTGRTLRRLPPLRKTKWNSNADITTAITDGQSITVTASGANQGRFGIAFESQRWMHDGQTAKDWVYLEGTSLPTGVESGKPYCLGDYGGQVYALFKSRADAIAKTNPVIPQTGTISAGSGVKVFYAHAPMSLPPGIPNWESGGERNEIGLVSEIAQQAIIFPNKTNDDMLRVSGMNQNGLPFSYRGTTTFRVPDVHTDSATYSGLGTGHGSTYSTNPGNGGPYNMVNPTAQTGGGDWYDDDELLISSGDMNHVPSPDFFWSYITTPWPWILFETAPLFGICIPLRQYYWDRNKYFNSTVRNNMRFGDDGNGAPRCSAWALRSCIPLSVFPSAITSGTYGERTMFSDIIQTQDSGWTDVYTEMQTKTPNLVKMGLFPFTGNVAPWIPLWQYGAYWSQVVAVLNGYTGVMSDHIDFLVKFAKGISGYDPGNAGAYNLYDAGGYYQTIYDERLFRSDPNNPYLWWDAQPDMFAGMTNLVSLISFDTTANTVTFTATPNYPHDSTVYQDRDIVRFYKAADSVTMYTGLAFNTDYYMANVSIAGDGVTVTCQLSATPGGSVIDFSGSGVGIGMGARHAPSHQLSYGWGNAEFANGGQRVYAIVYAMSWCRSGLDTMLTAVDNRMKNGDALNTDPSLGPWTRYSWDKTICSSGS